MILNEKTILALVESGESETLEFKRNFDKDAIETITAFANTKGGIILVGVEDNGNISGIIILLKTYRWKKSGSLSNWPINKKMLRSQMIRSGF